jgi:hypothetical protein
MPGQIALILKDAKEDFLIRPTLTVNKTFFPAQNPA